MIKKEDHLNDRDFSCELPMVISKLGALENMMLQFEDPEIFISEMFLGIGCIIRDAVEDLKVIDQVLYSDPVQSEA